jgi:hypothetical protein
LESGTTLPRQTNNAAITATSPAPANEASVRSTTPNAGAVNQFDTASIGGTVSPLQQLRQGWVDFLGRWEWHWFCTLTFDPERSNSPNGSVHPEKALKCFRRFVNELNCTLFGKNWKRRGEGVYWVVALEPHKSGLLHIHALVGASVNLNDALYRSTWKEWWYQQFGRAKVEVT